MNAKMRSIRPDEVEIRKKGTSKDGLRTTWLLYKTARVDSAILTETFGPFGWQNKFERVGDTLFCSIGVKDPDTGEWIWKTDAGDETQMEAVKGEASDAFKRAGFKWGIGVQLYNAPIISLNPKYKYVDIECIELDNTRITKLVLKSGKEVVFNWSYGKDNNSLPTKQKVDTESPSYKALLSETKALEMDMSKVHEWAETNAGISPSDTIPEEWLAEAIRRKKAAIAEKAGNGNK